VDVVAGGLGHWSFLPPAGHPPVDEARVARHADVRAEPEPLHHARPEPLDQRVCFLDKLEGELDRVGLLEVEGDALAPPLEHAFVVLGLGVVLAAAAAMELWVGLAAERVSDLVRPEMTDSGLVRHRQDFESARTAVTGLSSDVLPAVATSLGVPEDRLRQQVT